MKTPYELGYESESLGLNFADSPFFPGSQEYQEWVNGKCTAINERKPKPPEKAIIAYAYDEFGPCQPL